jgi:hypothetical protein
MSVWNGLDRNNRMCHQSYFYRLRQNKVFTRRMMLLKRYAYCTGG